MNLRTGAEEHIFPSPVEAVLSFTPRASQYLLVSEEAERGRKRRGGGLEVSWSMKVCCWMEKQLRHEPKGLQAEGHDTLSFCSFLGL